MFYFIDLWLIIPWNLLPKETLYLSTAFNFAYKSDAEINQFLLQMIAPNLVNSSNEFIGANVVWQWGWLPIDQCPERIVQCHFYVVIQCASDALWRVMTAAIYWISARSDNENVMTIAADPSIWGQLAPISQYVERAFLYWSLYLKRMFNPNLRKNSKRQKLIDSQWKND